MADTGKSAVITGAGNGIGRAIALELAGRGYSVLVSDIAGDEAEAVAGEISSAQNRDSAARAFATACDVSSEVAVGHLAELSTEHFDTPDLVFSNAGALISKPVSACTREDLNWIFSLNVYGMVDVARRFAALSIRTEKPTRIVVTGSEHSVSLPHGGSAAYTATKHAMLGFAEAMRDEWKDQPPNVSILCPGLTQSRLWEGQRHRPNPPETLPGAKSVQNRGMSAEDLAKTAVDGAEAGLFYIFTHSHIEQYVKARFTEMTEAFQHLNKTAPTAKNYDVATVIQELMGKRSG